MLLSCTKINSREIELLKPSTTWYLLTNKILAQFGSHWRAEQHFPHSSLGLLKRSSCSDRSPGPAFKLQGESTKSSRSWFAKPFS